MGEETLVAGADLCLPEGQCHSGLRGQGEGRRFSLFASCTAPGNLIFKKNFFSLIFFNVYLYLRERETGHEQVRGREMDTESEAGSKLGADSTEPDIGLELMDHDMT